MNIWLITVGEPLPTEGAEKRPWRTGLLARMLANQGHHVVWWTSSVNHFQKTLHVHSNARVTIDPYLDIQFLHGGLYTRNISLNRFWNHWVIGREFKRLAPTQQKPDLILCSLPTLELSDEAVKFGRNFRIPVLLDIRDRWPDELASALPGPLPHLGPVLLFPMFAQARNALAGATGLIAISRSYLDWGLKLAGRSQHGSDGIFTHGYPRSTAAPLPRDEIEARLRKIGVDPTKRLIWFIGTFVGSIDLSTVISAARSLQEQGHSDTQFVLSGEGQDAARYRSEAEGLQNVVFTGWVNKPEIEALSQSAWAGLAAYKKGALMSLTNKVFEYLSAGTPLLISLRGEAESIVIRNACGLVYQAGEPASLVENILRITADVALHDAMSTNARELFEREYDAANVYAKMIEFIERVAKGQYARPTDTAH
jgi:glycosyltransferase involved in cell wall biosynthesis